MNIYCSLNLIATEKWPNVPPSGSKRGGRNSYNEYNERLDHHVGHHSGVPRFWAYGTEDPVSSRLTCSAWR